MRAQLDRALTVLNGVFGDSLQRYGTGLAIPMTLFYDQHPIALTRQQLTDKCPEITSRVVVFVHGLMSSEQTWVQPNGSWFGSALASDLGYTPFAIRYNTGLHISDNGEALDALLEALVAAYPVPIEEVCLIGHSMGGLVIRSATHAAATIPTAQDQRRWLPLVRRAIYLGTPHLGAPLERAGNVVTWILRAIGNPYTKLIADIGNLRSSGIKDLRYANLRREDWEGWDADALLKNRRHPVPLMPHIRHYLVAGTVMQDSWLTALFGDAVVPLRSATGQARKRDRSPSFAQEQVRVVPGLSHAQLTGASEVYDLIRVWCGEPLPPNTDPVLTSTSNV